MIIEFSEAIALSAPTVYGYFRTPGDWVRLFGFAGTVEDRGGGWYAVPLRRFPFPLVAKITAAEPCARVAWQFRGFWRGRGEVRILERTDHVIVEGYEQIGIRALGPLSRLVEHGLLEREFRRIWAHGWKRLRREADEHGG